MRRRWWLEIGPLKEGNYTGISQVTAALAHCMLEDRARATGFFYGRAAVSPEIVAEALVRRNGELLEWHLARACPATAPQDLAGQNIAIFPNRKTGRRDFDFEAQIVHDLSTLLTPQFHHADTIEFHALTMLEDVHSNDLTICVSEATRADVLRYLGPLDPARVIATPLAGSHPTMSQREDPRPGWAAGQTVEPYVLVLGTVEPRKNIDQVLTFLASCPDLLSRLRFVFLGRYGWGEPIETLLQRRGLYTPYQQGRIVFPGFVSEPSKFLLLEHARLLVYPSLFEGFGLPVLEAITLGTPCLTTNSSSLAEAGGPACTYFDPFVPGDFDRAFDRALQDSPKQRAARKAWGARFSWPATYAAITGAIEARLAGDEHAR